MITTIDEFKQAWASESCSTGKLMKALTDKSLAQPVGPGQRTLGRVAWHIIQTIMEMAGRTGLTIDGPKMDDPAPASAKVFGDAYDKAAASLLEQVSNCWKDETLQIEDDMYGERWKRGVTLNALISHEVHHRGQMTVLMRQAALNVPGVYGPSRDEWGQYGMNPPEI